MQLDVQTTISCIAICVSVIAVVAAFYGVAVAKRLSSSDHRAAEQVKSDMVRLNAAIMSIAENWAFDSQGERKSYDASKEREVLADFTNSESAIALRAWIRDNGAKIHRGWRTFFPDLAYLSMLKLSEINPKVIAGVIYLLESLERQDVEAITQYNADLVTVMTSGLPNDNAIALALLEMRKDDEERSYKKQRKAIKQLTWLRADGVDDPNVDRHLAQLTENSQLFEEAVARGAVRDVPLPDLIRQYQDRLKRAGLL